MGMTGETGYHTSDAVFELAVLGGVDERVDTAVGEHQHHGKVVEPEGHKSFRRKTKCQSRSSLWSTRN